MEKLRDIYQSLWKLVLELEMEGERYDELSYQILQRSLGLFDEEQRTLSPDALEKYLRITKVQPKIKLKIAGLSLVIERDLLVHRLTDPITQHIVRSLKPFYFMAQTEAEEKALLILSLHYEEWEEVTRSNNFIQSFLHTNYITLPDFKFYLSLISSTIQKAKTPVSE